MNGKSGETRRVMHVLLWVALGLGIAQILLTFGLFVQAPWAVSLWPWKVSRLSCIFLSSICAAVAAPVIWIWASRTTAAITGGAVNLGVASAGIAAYVFGTATSEQQKAFAMTMAAFCLTCFVQLALTWKEPFQDQRPTPALVRYSFALFALVLIFVGGTLVLNAAPMFPWPLKPAQNVIYGWIFLGASTYFLYGFIRPVWGNAVGQLLGFLAYDLILIVPYVQHFAKVPPELFRNLVIYVCVLVYSGLLATWYLFINPSTRFKAQQRLAIQETVAN